MKARTSGAFKFYQTKYDLEEGNAYAFSDRVELKDTLLLSNPYYNKFITQLITNIALYRLRSDGSKFAIEPYVDLAMLTVDDLTEGAATASKFKALLLNKLVEEIAMDDKRAWIGKVSSTLTDLSTRYGDKSISFVGDKLNRVAEDLRFIKGNPAPAFTLTDLNGKRYSLHDFKGKKVYMDLGASWCKPCIEGIPAWNDLVKKYESKEHVVFISLSLDDREDQWQRWVKKYHPKGLLLYAGEAGFKSKFAKEYNVKAIPRFILLDEEGKIEAFSAPEPKDIRDMLLPNK